MINNLSLRVLLKIMLLVILMELTKNKILYLKIFIKLKRCRNKIKKKSKDYEKF